MKKFILAALFSLLAIPAFAQYPISASVVWDTMPTPADPTQVITKYTVSVNGVATDVSPTTCTPTECSFRFSIPSSSQQVVTVTQTNMWGTSLPAQLTFTATIPGNSKNVKVRTP